MPVSSEPDTYSLLSQATTTLTIGDSLPAQLVRKSARKGFTFNIMSVGPSGLGKSTLLSGLFGKDLHFVDEENQRSMMRDPLNPPVQLESKAFEIDEKKVRLRLTVVKCKQYGEALCTEGTHKPLVEYIDKQFADYHARESSYERRNIQDKMIHCLFFFISPTGHGLSKLDLEFLSAIHNRVNIIPIIARAEKFTHAERAAFKRHVKDDLEKNKINVYHMPDPDPEDTDDMKRAIKEIQEAWPFAVTSMTLKNDSNAISVADYDFDWARIDPYNRDHSDFLLLKTVIHMQMPDLCDTTHEVFYEDYRRRCRRTTSRAGDRAGEL